MDYIIRTQFREKVTSLTLNEKIDILVGSNRVLDGFTVTFDKGNLNLSNGKCVINGTCIKSVFKKNKLIQIPSNFRLHSELWLSLQYNYEKNTIKEIISENEPVQNYLISLCKLKKNGEGYIIIPLNRALDLSSVSDIANETYKSQKELQKAYDDQIKNMTQSNPSNMEVVDARGGFAKLKDKLKNIEDVALEGIDSVRANINENANRIDELSNHTPVWRDYTGNGAITAHDTFYGVAKNITIKGKTLRNLYDPKHSIGGTLTDDGFRSFIFSSIGWNTVGYQNNPNKHLWKPLLKPNTSYTLIAEVVENTLSGTGELFRLNEPAKQRIFRTAVKLPNNFTGVFISKITTRDGEEFEAAYHGLYPCTTNYCTGGAIKIRYMIFEGELSENEIPNTYFNSIKSIGDKEENKVVLKSVGKNLSPISIGEIPFSNVQQKGILIEPSMLNVGATHTISFNIKSNSLNAPIKLRYRYTDGTTNYPKYFSTGTTGVVSYTKSDNKKIKDIFIYTDNSTAGVCSIEDIQIEEDVKATNCERYRESIKEIELPMAEGLKSLPNGVADFIDCYGVDKSITDIVQQVEKFILDGNKEWRIGIWNNENIISFQLENLNVANIKSDNTICEELECISMSDIPDEVEEISECITGENGKIVLVIEKSKLNTPDVVGLRSYLSANPITLYYELKNKIIHKIDNLEPLKTYEGTTHIYQENNIQGDKQVSVLTSFKKSLERLEEEKKLLKRDNSDLSSYVKLQSEYFYEQNLSLASSNLDLDFRVMELEFALDIPVILKGDRDMAARTPYEMMKILIIGGKYDREDLEYKMSVYIKRGRMTQEEADELTALMDARELENR